MHVKATNRGFYKWIRQIGEEFEIPSDLFAKEWMEPMVAEELAPVEVTPKPPAVKKDEQP